MNFTDSLLVIIEDRIAHLELIKKDYKGEDLIMLVTEINTLSNIVFILAGQSEE